VLKPYYLSVEGYSANIMVRVRKDEPFTHTMGP
jgi:hypothetical protein